jgi:predicted nucleic acid-binding protein
MRVYLDNCCFNRPFDEQVSAVIRLETDAKIHVQELIRSDELELCWSFVLDFENAANPFTEVRNRIIEWKSIAVADCALSDEITGKAAELMKLGLKQMDAAHLACAIYLKADYFLTTDKRILNKPIKEIAVMNPIDFLRRYFDAE